MWQALVQFVCKLNVENILQSAVLRQAGNFTFFYHGEISRVESERRLRAFSQTNKGIQAGGFYLVRRKGDTAYV